MAHSAVLTSNLDGATGLELVAGPTEGIWLAPEGEGLFVPPAYTETYASSPGGEGGIRTRSDPENVVGTGKVYFTGATQAAFWANIATFEQTIEQCRKYGGTLVYEPDSGPMVTYEVESAHLLSLPQRGFHLGQRHAESDFELVFKPYGLLESTTGQVRITDDFSYDSIALNEWTFDIGSGTFSISGGELIPTTNVEKRMYRNVKTGDVATGTLEFTTGASVSGAFAQVVLKRVDASNDLRGSISGSGLIIQKWDVAASTNLATTAYTWAVNTTYWLRFTADGDDLTLTIYTADPEDGTAAAATRTHTLTGADATKFGAGVYGYAGIRVDPAGTDERYKMFYIDAVDLQVATDPLLVFEIPEQDGSVDALVEVQAVNSNEDAHPYAFFEWGMESAHWSSDASWPLLIDDADMTVLESATRNVAEGSAAWQGTSTQQSLTTASKGVAIVTSTHVGRFHVKVRMHSAVVIAFVYVRLAYSYRGGGTEFLPWVQVPSAGDWFEVDLGVVTIPPSERGTAHDATFSIYAKATTAITFKLDYLKFIPAERYGKASDDGADIHPWIARLKLAHDGAWMESSYGSEMYDHAKGYVGSYLRVPTKGGRFVLYEASDDLDTEAHTTGFGDDEVRLQQVSVTPRVVLLGE